MDAVESLTKVQEEDNSRKIARFNTFDYTSQRKNLCYCRSPRSKAVLIGS